MTETKFDLREKLYEYLKANKLNLTRFLDTNGVAHGSVNALIRSGDESLLGKRLQTLKLILAGIGCTFDDYDPRIMQGFRGARRIKRAIDRGTSVWSICNYTGSTVARAQSCTKCGAPCDTAAKIRVTTHIPCMVLAVFKCVQNGTTSPCSENGRLKTAMSMV